jgi:hypothetical protein
MHSRALPRRHVLHIVALMVVAVATVLGGTLIAMASHVEPRFVEGNPKCPEGLTALEASGDGFHNGNYSDGKLTVTISNFNPDTKTFDWSSNIGVKQVIVKGGPNANVYDYDPASKGDTGLHTPFNEGSQQNYGLSHVLFCYVAPASSPSPTPSPSESESPQPSVSPTETPTNTPSESPSVLPTRITQSPSESPSVLGSKLGRTGADILKLIAFALALIGLGSAVYVVTIKGKRSEQ